MGPKSNDRYPFWGKAEGDLGQRDTQRKGCGDGGRDWVKQSPVKGAESGWQPPRARTEAGNRFSLRASRRDQPADTLISGSGLQNCEMIHFSVLSQQFVVLCYSSPGKLAQRLNQKELVASREIQPSVCNYVKTKDMPPNKCLYSFCWSSSIFLQSQRVTPSRKLHSLETYAIKITYSHPET